MKAHSPLALVGVVLLGLAVLGACERTVTTIEVTTTASSCFACHSDQNTALVSAEGQYIRSKHASADELDHNSSTCSRCHTSEGFVNYITTGTGMSVDNPTAIHCFTCHAPHTNENLSLRVTAAQPLQNGVSFDLGKANLCVACHQARRDVTTYVAGTVNLNRFWGPHHSVQGDMLIGSNGYEYTGFSYSSSPHKFVADDGCQNCHFDVTSNYRLGGHSFNMEWDDNGQTEHNTDSCEPCHSDIGSDFDYRMVQTNTEVLIDSLRTILEGAGLLDGSDQATSTTTSADSAGAVWNFFMGLEDQSDGVHNLKYIQGLLESSIQFMESTLVVSDPIAVRKENAHAGSR